MIISNIKRYGFIPSKIDENVHYILGDNSLSPEILMPNGHGWADFLPTDEFQNKNGLETMNCSNYGTLHALATLGKKKFGNQFQTDLSERYTGVMTGTSLGGNDPHTVIEKIRTLCGVVPEVFLPFDDNIKTWDDYFGPNPMTYNLFATGRNWLKKYKVSHQWLWGNNVSLIEKQNAMKTGLQYSPLGASVYAWDQHADGLYYGNNIVQNHWIEVYDYLENVYWNVFDTYDKTHKKLEWNFYFGMAKGYGLDLNPTGQNSSYLSSIIPYAYALYRINHALGLN